MELLLEPSSCRTISGTRSARIAAYALASLLFDVAFRNFEPLVREIGREGLEGLVLGEPRSGGEPREELTVESLHIAAHAG